MKTRESKNPYGYKDLLVYQKAEEVQQACSHFTSHFPREKTLLALADQMDRSARSVKQNIVEGWKRNSTKEYYDFLGFSMGANAELEEDCDDIIKGIYKDLKGIKGMEGGGEGGYDIKKVESLPFYPLDTHLPLLVQLKLRCKELTMLLHKLQNSLENKVHLDKLERSIKGGTGGDAWLERTLEEQGFTRLPDGQVIAKKGL